jgi:hypothetical protein
VPINAKGGWGFKTALVPVSQTQAGINVVQTDVGVAIVVQAAGPIRLSKLMYRADLAPDVPAGSVSSPTRFRVVVLVGTQVPQSVSAWQAQDFGATATHPEIATRSPLQVEFDAWLDFGAGDAGLNELAFVDFSDAGPYCPAGGAMVILFVPVIDSQMDQSIIPANGTFANAQMTIAAYGLGEGGSPQGGSDGAQSGRSLPRYDVSL